MTESAKVIPHNLNISMYSFREILDLFSLTYDITEENMKTAKKQVLMTHPDKSRLGPEYFLFYKNAFDEIIKYYIQQNRENQKINKTNIEYSPLKMTQTADDQIRTKITEMTTQNEFNNKFNKMFEETINNTKIEEKNKWFSYETTIFSLSEPIIKQNINEMIQQVKEQQHGLIKYSGVKELNSSSSGDFLYENDNNLDGGYITTDPFQKLRFDDIQKVHKDQTVFAVGEKDYANIKIFKTVQEAIQVRDAQTIEPMAKHHAELMLNQKNRLYNENIAEKQHMSELQTQIHEEQNKNILSRFLMIM